MLTEPWHIFFCEKKTLDNFLNEHWNVADCKSTSNVFVALVEQRLNAVLRNWSRQSSYSYKISKIININDIGNKEVFK